MDRNAQLRVNQIVNPVAVMMAVDASIVALYNDTRKPDSDMMERIIKISWKSYVSKIIQDVNPKKIIVIGKGVHKSLEREVDLNADKKRMWIPAIGIKSINTKEMNVSVPLNLGVLTKSQI